MTNATKTERPFMGWVAKRVEFLFAGTPWVAQETRNLGHAGNPIEVYAVDRGMEQYVGSVATLAKARPVLAVAAVEALASDRRAF